MKTGLMLFALTILFLAGCQKRQPVPSQEIPENALWRAPNGYVIPWSEHDNWQEYTAQALTQTKEMKKYWKSNLCTSDAIRCGQECIKATKNEEHDCVKEEPCAPCVGCGCTPVISPY